MAQQGLLLASILFLSCLAQISLGEIYFADLKKTLTVTASPKLGQVIKAGEENITVGWSVATSTQTTGYKSLKVRLCYAPISQKERAWRKTKPELSKDKTCQHKIETRAFTPTGSLEWTVMSDIPQATYFVRAYAVDSAGHEVAYGQSTDDTKSTNLFVVQAVTGRHKSMDVASICFSAFSVLSLAGFFIAEKRKGKAQARAQANGHVQK